MKILAISFDEVQKAMEDLNGSAEYFLDLESGTVICCGTEILSNAISLLYHESPEEDDDLEIEFDSNVNMSPDLPDDFYPSLENSIELSIHPEKYLKIPTRDSSEAYICMSEFTETIEDDALKSKLRDTLRHKSPFRNFKAVLAGFPRTRKKWNAFNARRMSILIRDWLMNEGVRAVRRRGRL